MEEQVETAGIASDSGSHDVAEISEDELIRRELEQLLVELEAVVCIIPRESRRHGKSAVSVTVHHSRSGLNATKKSR
jgi:hypothetical protein